MLSSHLMVAEFLKPQGVRGEVKARPITCDIGRFEGMKEAFLKKGDEYEKVSVVSARDDGEFVYLHLEGYDDRDAAEKLRGEGLYVDRAHAVELPEDADFICDLIGCAAEDDEGSEIGTLTDVLQPGGNDVYVFEGSRGTVLVPALKSVVQWVHADEKKMRLCAKRLREVAVYQDED